MKTLTITMLLLLTSCMGCKKDFIKGYYDSMHFVREGGGQIEFSINTTDNSDKLFANVTKYNFRDTTIHIVLDLSTDNSSVFSLLSKAMNNQVQINGGFHQSTLPTGTWAYIYLISHGKETEVTNVELRNSLLQFEGLVEDKIH